MKNLYEADYYFSLLENETKGKTKEYVSSMVESYQDILEEKRKFIYPPIAKAMQWFLNKNDSAYLFRSQQEIEALYNQGTTLSFIFDDKMAPREGKLEKYRTGFYLPYCGGVNATTVKTKIISHEKST